MTNKRRAVVGTLIVLTLIGGGSWLALSGGDGESGGNSDGPAQLGAEPTTTVPLPPTTAPADPTYGPLAGILPDQLEGYRVNTGAKATGPLDLAAAVAAESDSHAERNLLETRKYEAGYGRAFTNDQADVYMTVYDFPSSDAAQLYVQDGLITLYGDGAGTYDVTTVPGGRGFSQGIEFNGRPAVVHGVAFAKADKFILVFRRSAGTSTPAEAEQLAQMLYGRAPA